MTDTEKCIFECTKEIVVAKVASGTNVRADKDGGEAIGEFLKRSTTKSKSLLTKPD